MIGSFGLFFLAFLRRRLPETKRFQARQNEVQRLHARIGGALEMVRRLLAEHPGRIALILLIAAAWGFAVGPATVLQNKYLQQTLHFLPWQTTLLAVPGGLFALWLNILMGRASDRIGRRLSIFLMMALCGAGYAFFYSGFQGWMIPPLWIVSFFAFFSADALLGALAIEIVPTAYRATVGGLRYMVEIFMGGVACGWKASGTTSSTPTARRSRYRCSPSRFRWPGYSSCRSRRDGSSRTSAPDDLPAAVHPPISRL